MVSQNLHRIARSSKTTTPTIAPTSTALKSRSIERYGNSICSSLRISLTALNQLLGPTPPAGRRIGEHLIPNSSEETSSGETHVTPEPVNVQLQARCAATERPYATA